MKVLMINGSPHKEGNTFLALREMQKIFEKEGVESKIIQIGKYNKKEFCSRKRSCSIYHILQCFAAASFYCVSLFCVCQESNNLFKFHKMRCFDQDRILIF